MDKNDQPKFYDQINEDDLPPLITTQQSTFNYNELLEAFMPQAAIFATPVSYCFPSPSIVIAKDNVESHDDVPKPKEEEEVVPKSVVEPPPPEEPVVVKEKDTAQSSEETVVEIKDDSETESDTEIVKKEVPEVAGSLAIVHVNDRNKGLLLLEGPKVSEQVKPTLGRKKRTRAYPDWLLENFIIEARPRINGKTVDKYYYHRVTKVKCRSTIEAEDYFRHGINPNDSKKRKRDETQRVVVKFLKESYENLLRWFDKRDNLQTLFDDVMKNEEDEEKSEDKGKGKEILVENNDELEKEEKKNTEEKGEPEEPKAKNKGIPMEGTEVVVIEDDDDDEPVPMEVTLGAAGSVSLEEKNLVEIPIGWFF